MTTNLQQRIDQMMALDAKRTQGEWHQHSYHISNGLDGRGEKRIVANAAIDGKQDWQTNAAFIAAAPEMVALIREQQAMIDELRGVLEHAISQFTHAAIEHDCDICGGMVDWIEETIARFSPTATGGK